MSAMSHAFARSTPSRPPLCLHSPFRASSLSPTLPAIAKPDILLCHLSCNIGPRTKAQHGTGPKARQTSEPAAHPQRTRSEPAANPQSLTLIRRSGSKGSHPERVTDLSRLSVDWVRFFSPSNHEQKPPLYFLHDAACAFTILLLPIHHPVHSYPSTIVAINPPRCLEMPDPSDTSTSSSSHQEATSCSSGY